MQSAAKLGSVKLAHLHPSTIILVKHKYEFSELDPVVPLWHHGIKVTCVHACSHNYHWNTVTLKKSCAAVRSIFWWCVKICVSCLCVHIWLSDESETESDFWGKLQQSGVKSFKVHESPQWAVRHSHCCCSSCWCWCVFTPVPFNSNSILTLGGPL